MAGKLLNDAKLRIAAEEASEDHEYRDEYRWTLEMIAAMTDEYGDDVACPRCGCVIRECIQDGGPSLIQQWKFKHGRWTHRCRGGKP